MILDPRTNGPDSPLILLQGMATTLHYHHPILPPLAHSSPKSLTHQSSNGPMCFKSNFDRSCVCSWWPQTLLGGPSIIPTSYINQCNILLNFYRSTMQDGMIVAEIMLYSALHQKLSRRSYLDDSDECEEFLSWKHKWNYLLGKSHARARARIIYPKIVTLFTKERE